MDDETRDQRQGFEWRRLGIPLAILVPVLVLAGWWLTRNGPLDTTPERPPAIGTVYENVTVRPQPVIEDTMVGDCTLSEMDAGGYRRSEIHDSVNAAGTGRLTVTEAQSTYAYAKFEDESGDTGTFIWWSGTFRPTSDPCGH